MADRDARPAGPRRGARLAGGALDRRRRRSRRAPERTKALGVWAAIAVGGGAVGLLLGGILVDTLSWPWIFFVNVPVGIATFVLSLRFVPESKDEHAHKSFDLAGAVTVTGGLIALVYGIVRSAESGWGSGEVLGFLALAVVLLVAFVLIERRSVEPLVRLSIFSVRTVRGANVAMFVVAAGLFAMFFFNTLYVQRVLGFTPLEAGLAFLPFTLGIIIGAGLSQPLVPKLGAREVPLIGSMLGAPGCSSSCGSRRTAPTWPTSCRGSCSPRSAWGSSSCPITLIATSGVPVDDAGLASGLFNTVAADRRRARARAAHDPRDEPHRGRARLARRRADARPTRPRRSSRASTSPGSRARSCSPPAGSCSSPSCAAATWSPSPRARPRPCPV